MSERFFNRNQAEKLLPWLENLMGQAQEQKLQADGIDEEIGATRSRILLHGGMTIPYRRLAEMKLQKDRNIERVRELIRMIEQKGCVIKNLEEGLVDFPCRRENRKIYLCWKLGEERVLYWHGMEEGFAGRKPLDESQSKSESEPSLEPPAGSGRPN